MEGYYQTNNPNKGLGVIHHGAVSNCTSLYCGCHVASRKESTIDCVKILLLALSGASIESQISLNRTKIFWDRGCGGVEGEENTFAIEKGAVLVGTSRRMKLFPFTLDQHPGPSRRLIKEKGTMASYWAVRQSGQNKQFALAHRSDLGWVVLIHKTDESLGPGRYTLFTQRRKDAPIRYFSDDDPVVSYYAQYGVVTMLTESVVDEVVNTRERLNNMILPDLRVICCNKRLPVSGTKPVLIERIIVGGSGVGGQNNGDVGQQQEVPTILNVLMKSWFMAPFKSKLVRKDFEQTIHFLHFPKFVLVKSASIRESPAVENRKSS